MTYPSGNDLADCAQLTFGLLQVAALTKGAGEGEKSGQLFDVEFVLGVRSHGLFSQADGVGQ